MEPESGGGGEGERGKVMEWEREKGGVSKERAERYEERQVSKLKFLNPLTFTHTRARSHLNPVLSRVKSVRGRNSFRCQMGIPFTKAYTEYSNQSFE